MWIYPYNFQMLTVLPFNSVRYLNYSSLKYFHFKFESRYTIQRDSFLLFLLNIIINIISSYGQVIKMRVFFCINSLYWRFRYLYLHRLISIALLWINNSTVLQLCFCFNCSISIYILVINLFILSVISNHSSKNIVNCNYQFFGIMNRSMFWLSIGIHKIVISTGFLKFAHIWYCLI